MPNPENLVSCPYNRFHQVRRSRFVYHYLKCQKNHPNIDLKVCPYNATHLFPEEEEKYHLLDCIDRRIVDVQKYNELVPGRHGYLLNPPFYGSSRNFDSTPGDGQEITRQSAQNEQNAQGFNRTQGTSQRREDLRDEGRQSTIAPQMRASLGATSASSFGVSSAVSLGAASLGVSKNVSLGATSATSFGVSSAIPLNATSTASSVVKAPTYRPLRRPLGQGPAPTVPRRPSPFQMRRRSPSSEKRSLRSLSPASTIRSCSPSPVRQAQNQELPTELTLERGRLVPRKKSTSPSVASRATTPGPSRVAPRF